MTPLDDIVSTLRQCANVEAIALGGSRSSAAKDAASDVDVIVFARGQVDLSARRSLAMRHDPAPEIANMYWGEGDYWFADGVAYDVYFFDPDWFQDEVEGSVLHHRAKDSYSTCFWFTAQHCETLFDRNGWLDSVKSLAQGPYPPPLRDAIVRHHLPMIDGLHTSYRNQIALALQRSDWVSVQHRTTALLASVFDVLFALSGLAHPGEKRQVAALRGHVHDALLNDIERAARVETDHLVTIDRIAEATRALATQKADVPKHTR